MATAHLIVSALLRRDGRILLVREQGPADAEPTWMLPGGRVEARESVLEALGRELREETGLSLIGPPALGFLVHVLGYNDSYAALTFDCEADGDLGPDDPDGFVLDVAWVDEAEALSRLSAVPWYDLVPLRCHLAGEAASGATYVVDRR